jgi:hypothetical protein
MKPDQLIHGVEARYDLYGLDLTERVSARASDLEAKVTTFFSRVRAA